LSAYFEQYRQEYCDRLLGVSQRGKGAEWFMFFFRGMGTQAQDSIVRMTRLQNIRAEFDAIVQKDRNPTRMAAVIDFPFARPILNNRQLASGLNIPLTFYLLVSIS
jgi:hypothetical protein